MCVWNDRNCARGHGVKQLDNGMTDTFVSNGLLLGTSVVIRSITPTGVPFHRCSILTRFSRHASVQIWRSPRFIVVAATSPSLGERRHSQPILKRLLQSSSEILHRLFGSICQQAGICAGLFVTVRLRRDLCNSQQLNEVCVRPRAH